MAVILIRKDFPLSVERVVIIGSGPAAWSAAIYAARAELLPLVFEGAITEENRIAGTLPLGQLNLTTEVENYAGFPAGNLEDFLNSSIPAEVRMGMAPHSRHGISGPELMELMRQQAKNFGTRVVTDDIVKVNFKQHPYELVDSRGATTRALTVIVATGARANYLGLPSEEAFKNRGVSACAVCDGALPRFRNKPLVVIGGGDSAVEEATYLTKFAISTMRIIVAMIYNVVIVSFFQNGMMTGTINCSICISNQNRTVFPRCKRTFRFITNRIMYCI